MVNSSLFPPPTTCIENQGTQNSHHVLITADKQKSCININCREKSFRVGQGLHGNIDKQTYILYIQPFPMSSYRVLLASTGYTKTIV